MPLSPEGHFIFARVSKDGALWGPLLEKGFAKLQGNYENIVGGDPITSIAILSGAPGTRYHHSGHPDNKEFFKENPKEPQTSALDLFNLVLNAPKDSMISALSPGDSNEEKTLTGLT